MVYDISVLIPGIRPHNWIEVFETLKNSCKKYSFEIVFAGPFNPPKELVIPNVQYIKTYMCPSSAGQYGASFCRGKLILHSVDDSRFIPDAVDLAADLLHDRKTVINMRYTENDNYSGTTFPPEYWFAHYHGPMKLPGIHPSYKIALHFLMDFEYFKELGGFDCSYEYMNFNLHDLMFRVQYDGGKVLDSPTDVTNCNHYGNRSMDHAAIEDAYELDIVTFRNKYNNQNALNEHSFRIPFDNWKQRPYPWNRRFSKKLFTSYGEMMS